MGFSIHGYVLEPPRIGGSNSPFTPGPNNFVPQTLLPANFTVTTGNSVVPYTGTDLSTGLLNVGDTIIFTVQLGVSYIVGFVSSTQIDLREVFSGTIANTLVAVSAGYSPQHGPGVEAFNDAYPKSEVNPRDDYLVIVTSELAPGVGTPFTISAYTDFNGLIQVTVPGPGNLVSDGQTVVISGEATFPAANGTWTVSIIDATDFVLNNSVFTGTPPPVPAGVGLVVQGSPGLLTCAGFGWTKNEIVNRFGYDALHGRFRTLPGGTIHVAGLLTAMANTMRLAVPPPLEFLPSAPYRLAILPVGAFDSGLTCIIDLVAQDVDFTTVPHTTPNPTVQLSLATGNLNWNTVDLTTYIGQQVNFQQQAYFALGTSTGNIGTISDLPSAPFILLNPIPGVVDLRGTFGVTHGSPSVSTSTSQVGIVHVGDIIAFAEQDVPYTVHAVTSSTITLTANYTGENNATTSAALPGNPAFAQAPLVRFGYLYWLMGTAVANESLFTPPTSGTFQWAMDTGRLNFNTVDLTNNNGTPVYYDGTLFEKDAVLPGGGPGGSRLLGPMPSSGLFVTPINTPVPASGDIIFFVQSDPTTNSPYYQFPYYEIIGLFDGGNNGTVEIQQRSGQVQFASGDAGQYSGPPAQNVYVIFADLPVDHGVSLRLFRSSVNLNGQTPGVKDVTSIYSVQNAVWASPIMGAPLVFLPSTPVDDDTLQVSVGQGTGFFVGTLNPVGGPSPVAGLGYTLDFDTNQLNFAERFQNVVLPIVVPSGFVQLPNSMVLTSNIVVSLETGPGTNVYMPQTVGEQVLIDGMGGFVYFATPFGVVVVQGSQGSFSAESFTDPTADFTPGPPSTPVEIGDFLLVLTDTKGLDQGVYTITGVPTSTTVTVDVTPPSQAHGPAPSGILSYQILSGKEVMADRFFQTVTLTDPTTSVRRITALGTIANATTIVPLGNATFPDLNTLQDLTTDFIAAGVQPGDTINLPAASPTMWFLVLEVAQHTLTPSVTFTTAASTYSVTRRLQVPIAYIGTLRFRYGLPTPQAPNGTFTTDVTAVASDAHFTAPSSLAQGHVQISRATGNLNFAQADVTNGGTVYAARDLALGIDYQVNAGLGLLQFQGRLLTNEEVLLTYTMAPPSTSPPTPPSPPITERGTFLVRKELTQPHPNPTSTLTFNPTGKLVAGNPAPSVWRGGRPQFVNVGSPQNTGQIAINIQSQPPTISFLPDNLLLNAIPHGAIVQPTENVYVDYYVYQAMGGELTLTVLQPPMLVAAVSIQESTNAFLIPGNQLSVFPAGFLMLVNNAEVYLIGSASYDSTAKFTTITLNGTQEFQSDQQNPPLSVVSGPTPFEATPTIPSYFTMELAPFFTVARGMNTINIPENKTSIYQTNVVLFITDSSSSFTDYYLVSSSTYNPTTNMTAVILATSALRQYRFGHQIIYWTVRPIFASAPITVHTSRTPIVTPTPQPMTVIRRVAGKVGVILSTPVGYTADTTANITYLSPLQPDEEFSVFYTGYRVVNWSGSAEGLPGPNLLVSYTATIVPDDITNGLLGQALNANYTIFSPDSFYYRVETLTNFKLQVAQEILQAAQSGPTTATGSGPMTSNTTSLLLYQQGNPGIWFPPGDYANHDIIAQASLLYFNNAVNDLEDVLHAIDGRIVGDVNGRFQFDGVIGRYDYYTYDYNIPPMYPFLPQAPIPANIPNQIDDNVQMLPGPLPEYPNYLPYFTQAYVTSPFSRFFKSIRNLRTTNPAVVSTAPNTGDVVATFNFSNLIQLPNTMFKRFPRAQVMFDTVFGNNAFYVDNTVGSGTLRPSWTVASPPASIIGMLVVVQDLAGNYYVDENDNAVVVGVSSPTGPTPGQITISGIAHTPAGPTGSPPSPPISGPSSVSGGATVLSVSGTTATIAVGVNGFGLKNVNAGGPLYSYQRLTLEGAAFGGNNGTFTIVGLNPLIGEILIDNPSAVAADPNNGSITWVGNYLPFVPQGSTVTVSAIDICVAQQETQNADSGASGTYNMFYGITGDVGVDPPTGNVLYQQPYWPFDGNSFFLLPQIFIPSSAYVIPLNNGDILEMDGTQVAVTNTSPYQFPALFGSTLDDDGNQNIPIVGPTFDGEMTEAGGGPLYIESTNEYVGGNFLTQIVTVPFTGTGNVVLTAGQPRTIDLTSAVAFPGNMALLGTFSVTKGSSIVPTQFPQTSALIPGNVVQFGSQPRARYTVLSVVGGTSPQITLTNPYTGTTAAPTTADIPLAGTFGVTRNSTAVSATVSQTGIVNSGDTLVFQTRPTVSYGVGTVTSISTTLTGNFTTHHTVTVDTSHSQVGILTPGDTVDFGLQPGIPYTVATVTPTSITLTVAYNGTTGSTTGHRLTSRILLVSPYLSPTNHVTTAVKKLAGTFNVTVTMNTVTTSLSQVGRLSFGDLITFASQPDKFPPYVVAGTALAGRTFNVSNSASVPYTGASLVGLVAANDTITFSSQPTVGYIVLTITSTIVTLTVKYTGTAAAAATGTKTDITSVEPFVLTLTTNYSGVTTSSTGAMLLGTGPADFNLVRVLASSAGNDSDWRPIASFTTTSVTVSAADKWTSIETAVAFAVAVSAANVPNATSGSVSGNMLTDSNPTDTGPFVGGPTTFLGNTYGVMTFLANSYNTTTLDTLAAIPPPTAQANWGSFTMTSAVSIGDIVTGTGIDPTQTVTVTQIGPGNSIQLSQATTGGNQTTALFFLQFTQPPPTTTPITFSANVMKGTTYTGSTGSLIAFDGTNLTLNDPGATPPFPFTSPSPLVGLAITLMGASYDNNNGTFIISNVISGTQLQFVDTAGIAPDPPTGPASISWSIPPSPSMTDIVLPALIGFQLGAPVTDTMGAIPGGAIITQIGPGFEITVAPGPTANANPDMVTVTPSVPPTPWSTTVDSLFINTYEPTQFNTDGFKQAMMIGPLVVSGQGITYNPELSPPLLTTIVSVGGSPPADTNTSFVMSLPASTSTLTGGPPLAYSNPTMTPTIITVYVPATVYVGWTVVITNGSFAGERRQVTAILATNELQVDHTFQSSGGVNYRLENTLDTYNGTTFQAIQAAMAQEIDVIQTRTRPPPRPYIYNLQSEQNALNDFFRVVFTTLIGPSTGAISNNPPGPAPFMILTDNTVNFIGPDPANPVVTTADFVYASLGTDLPVAQGFLATIATAIAGVAQFSDPTASWTVGDIGNFLIISGAAIPTNNGTFKIATFTSAHQVGINNAVATSVGETNNGMLNWFEYASNPVQEQDQGIYGIASVLNNHQLMISGGFAANGNISYSVVSSFGIGLLTLQNIFSIYEANATFVAQTEYFQAVLAATVPVKLNGTVDPNAYANGLNDLQNDMLNRYNQVENRLNYLSPTATNGPQAYIGAALSTTDNMYAMRYAWINARINLVSGYLILQNSAQANIQANLQAVFYNLIQLLTINNS